MLWGFAVEEAPNGAEAVKQARARPPNLIVMDLAMPVLDGRAAIQEFARDPATAHIPILALSAQTSIVPAGEGSAFIPKPTDPDDLLAQIRTTLPCRSPRSARLRRIGKRWG